MLAPVFWNTIFINNQSLIEKKVPREIVEIGTSDLYEMESWNEDNMSFFSSPRINKQENIFYLSNGFLSWINCPALDYEDLPLLWDDEISFLKKFGMKFGEDMFFVKCDQDNIYMFDEKNNRINCSWARILKKSCEKNQSIPLVWTEPILNKNKFVEKKDDILLFF